MPTKSPSTKKSAAASVRSGPVPPYGIAIREAISRGNLKEMQALATATRKHIKDVQSALAKLEGSIGRKR